MNPTFPQTSGSIATVARKGRHDVVSHATAIGTGANAGPTERSNRSGIIRVALQVGKAADEDGISVSGGP